MDTTVRISIALAVEGFRAGIVLTAYVCACRHKLADGVAVKLVAKIGEDRFGSIIEALLTEREGERRGSRPGGSEGEGTGLTDHLLRDATLGSSYTIVINPCV
jgi:hypothetical protein